jgi:hypothetical protein
MPVTTDIEKEIEAALAEIVIARDAAAAPLTFTEEAAEASDETSRSQFRANLPLIPGGFASIRKGLLSASALFGSTAKALAQFQDVRATEITLSQMELAREFAEQACRLRLGEARGKDPATVDVSDGLACG